ncbi:unnamed protein product [Peniophora sp. CBMAI 1063]|nr:unnamed protein product [Peniophora sp. CBMAI 1063]
MVRFGLPHRPAGGNGEGNNGPGTQNGLSGAYAIEPTSPTPAHNQNTAPGFFTLPLWKRRHGRLATPHDEHGQQIRQPIFDKALPPTPPASDEGHQLRATTPGLRTSPSQLSLATSRPASVVGPDQPAATVALAQASLGVGLPHVIGRASISSAASEGHADRPSPDHQPARASVRRVQSSQRLGNKHEELPLNVQTSRPDLPVDVTPPRQGAGMSRRPSFWKRRRYDSNKSAEQLAKEKEPEPTPSPVIPSILPRLPPVSPFDWDSSMASSSSSMLPSEEAALSPPRLVRRASDKRNYNSSPLYTASPPTSPSSPKSSKEPGTRRTPRRPSTAGGALDRPRAKSLYVEPSSPPAQDYPLPTPRKLPPPLLVPMPQPDEPPTIQALPRQRTTSNAPLLRRLSVNLFSFGNSSAVAVSPVVDRSNPLTSSPIPTASPRNSTSRTSLPPPRPNVGEETPEEYLDRLTEVVSKADVAGVLASSGDDFHTRALRTYIHRFEFAEDSLDVAVRRLLMHVGLPRETQQIDRVMEAFAQRYHQDHRDLYKSEDHPYILAFSLIMLHTDAFNKSNKRKMTKADYMKNTRLPGVPSEVLDCFYDNIVFAPFIFIEDPLDRGLASESSSRFLPGMTVSNGSAPAANGSSLTLIGKSNKVDPYYLITNNLLKPLRVDAGAIGPLEDPFSYHGTLRTFDVEELRMSFARAGVIEVSSEARRASTSVFAVSVGGFVAIPESESVNMTSDRDVVLKVASVGLLQRRDISLEGGKRAPARKWREWSVVLTATQLLFFRDPVWATHLQDQAAAGAEQLFMPPSSLLRPDEVLNIKDAIAVHDSSYGKSEPDYQDQDADLHTLLLVMRDGRQIRLRTPNEQTMNAWICRINYASTFKSTGVRMRPLGLSGKDVQLMGVAAAKSHLRDIRTQHATEEPAQRVRAAWDARPSTSTQGSSSTGDHALQLTASPPSTPSLAPSDGHVHPRQTRAATVAFDAPTAPIIDGAQQFKATFDQVKADLAAGRTPSTDDYVTRPRALSLESAIQPPWTGASSSPSSPDEGKPGSRAQAVREKIKALEGRIDAVQAELDADMLVLRNVAILTPFQRSTRDRLQAAAIMSSQRVRARRLELARLSCQREILADDILAEARDWRRNKFLALKAATDVLQTRGAAPVSRKKLSLHIEEPEKSNGSPSSLPTHVPETSTNDSFHSALEFECDTPANDGNSSITDSPLATPLLEERMSSSTSSFPFSPSMGTGTSSSGNGNGATAIARSHSHKTRSSHSVNASTPSDAARRHSSDRGSARHSPRPSSASGHERFVTARESQPEEEAEEWHRTRAAKRVSLVQVPSDLRLSRTHRPQPSLRSVQSADERAAGFVPAGDYVASFLS